MPSAGQCSELFATRSRVPPPCSHTMTAAASDSKHSVLRQSTLIQRCHWPELHQKTNCLRKSFFQPDKSTRIMMMSVTELLLKLVAVSDWSLILIISMSMTLHSKVNDNLHLRPKLKRDVKACASLCLEDLHCLDCLQCLHVPAPSTIIWINEWARSSWNVGKTVEINKIECSVNHLSAKSTDVISSRSVRFRPINCAAMMAISQIVAVNANYYTHLISESQLWHWKPWVHVWGASQGRAKLPRAASSCTGFKSKLANQTS